MEVNQYISELLYGQDCVIIPELGAFVSEYKPAFFNDSGEVLFPPSKEISFNPKLKNNDGLLMNAISANERISLTDALKKIGEFRDNIQYRLEKGETVEIEGLGSLKINDTNQMVFESESDRNFLLDAFGLNPASLKAPEAKPAAVMVKPAEKPDKRSWAWLFFLLIPAAAIAVFIYLYFSNREPNNQIRQPVEETAPGQHIEQVTSAIDSTGMAVDTIKKEVEPPAVTVQTNTPGEKYYLIGGSFMAKENADKYFSKVEKSGYQPVYLGKQGSFFIVAIGLYNSFEEADSVKNEYAAREPDSGIWVLKAKK